MLAVGSNLKYKRGGFYSAAEFAVCLNSQATEAGPTADIQLLKHVMDHFHTAFIF
jgi:hypothetical protein